MQFSQDQLNPQHQERVHTCSSIEKEIRKTASRMKIVYSPANEEEIAANQRELQSQGEEMVRKFPTSTVAR